MGLSEFPVWFAVDARDGYGEPIPILTTFMKRRAEMNNLLKILLAIFLPPVCAFIQVGFSLHFLINIVLTLLGGLPGMVHALWLVVSDKRG